MFIPEIQMIQNEGQTWDYIFPLGNAAGESKRKLHFGSFLNSVFSGCHLYTFTLDNGPAFIPHIIWKIHNSNEILAVLLT